MPLHGKIVVIKRSGGDGTEFPLTATCLFGRKPDCDIRIQLPQVSKEHCRIDLNENKEVVVTNLSTVNPTRVNGEVLQQSERLKHGDVITVIDRSFRFEYPPAPTPKKRSSSASKTETLKVLQDQQVVDTVSAETGEKRISKVFIDGNDHDQIQRSLEKTVEVESKQDSSMLQQKTTSPFNDLYQMIRQSLDVKTPRKSSASLFQTPTSRFCTPKPASVRKNDGEPVDSTHDKSTPKKSEAEVFQEADESKGGVESIGDEPPKSVKKHRRSVQLSTQSPGPAAEEAEHVTKSKRNSATSQSFTVCEAIEQVLAQTPKSPMRRRSKEATPAKLAVSKKQNQATTAPSTECLRRVSPRNLGKTEKDMSKKRKSGELPTDLPTSQMKRKRVSFGGNLSPELFDKRLPPDSPLQKGAVPRRSLCLYKPKQSLLRRASVTGLLQEFEQDKKKVKSPAKKKTPSPKKSTNTKSASPKTPTPEKKSPKAKSPSPKTTSPGKKSPSSRSCSPKAAGKSPYSTNLTPVREMSPLDKKKTPNSRRNSTTPGQVPCQETPSGKNTVVATPVKTPLNAGVCTPIMQGRFSVSRISTPSPVEDDAVPVQIPQGTVTPKVPLRRKSMKSTSGKTPSVSKSAIKVIRRSGISRASLRVKNSYADIVKFGQPKARAAAPVTKMNVIKKTTKKAVPKPQTPARKLQGHVSTGHADSPVTIVVGRAHKQKVVQPAGAAPKVIVNTALFKKNMKMDDDLTGISDMFKTPVNEKRRKSVLNVKNTTETPVGVMSTSVVDPSVLNTPEEPGEMVVSPLSVASVVKGRRYNSEAVQRLLNTDQESSCINEIAALDVQQQSTDVKTALLKTPKQKPEQPQCLTGVKRIMKTPKQKPEPVEDLRGKILKTPKQKPEQKECLTGVKRIMKTPKQKAEPVEDIRGKLLLTPKQKPEEKECLTGVKRIMKTPREKSQPIEDIRGNLLVTPKQKPEEKDCLTGVKRIFQTPQQEAEHLDDPQGEPLMDAAVVSVADVEELQETPLVCLTGVKSAPLEDAVDVRPMETPREKAKPIEDNFGIKTLMKSPRLMGTAPVEAFEGLKELMEEPQSDPSGRQETNKAEDQTPQDCGDVIAKELDFAHEEQQNKTPSDLNNDVPHVDMATEPGEIENETKAGQSEHNNESSDPVEAISETTEDNSSAVEQPKEAAVIENLSEEQLHMETTSDKVIELDTTAVDPVQEEKSVTEEKQEAREQSEDPVVPARKGRKPKATAPSTVRQTTRSRNTKTTVSRDADLTEEKAPQPSKASVKPRRGRNAEKDADQPEMVHVVATETEVVPEAEREQTLPPVVDHTALESAAPQEEAVSKPRRGRKAKQESKPSPPVMEKQDGPCAHEDNLSHVDMAKDVNGISSKSLAIMATDPQTPVTESVPEVDTGSVTEMDAATIKKPVRGRRAKMPQSNAAEDKQEAVDLSEDAAVPAPVRGRRGKKTETAAPPAVRRATRTRNAKSQESPCDDKPEHVQEECVTTQPATDISSEAVRDQTSLLNTCQEEGESASPAEEAVVKPTRGRKRKQTPVESSQPETNEAVSDENFMADSQPAIPVVVKPRRGRKTKPDTTEQSEATEDPAVAVETKQPSHPPARAKTGRKAKQDEENKENDTDSLPAEIPNAQEPVKTLRRTRKMEPEVPAVMSMEKPRRGRRGKEVSAEEVVTAEVPEEKLALEPEPEIKTNTEPGAPVIKPTRARGVKTAVKTEVSKTTPAKRARRGAASPLKDTNTKSTVLVALSEPTSVEPAKRGRRVAAAKASTVEPTVSSDQTEKHSDPSSAVVEDTKASKRSVRWKQELEVFQIPKVTPMKAVRGRKSKLVDQVEADSKSDANKTEEKDLSEEVVEAQPIKRARRGSKVADKVASSTTVDPKKVAEEETQVKTRRGRSAKK